MSSWSARNEGFVGPAQLQRLPPPPQREFNVPTSIRRPPALPPPQPQPQPQIDRPLSKSRTSSFFASFKNIGIAHPAIAPPAPQQISAPQRLQGKQQQQQQPQRQRQDSGPPQQRLTTSASAPIVASRTNSAKQLPSSRQAVSDHGHGSPHESQYPAQQQRDRDPRNPRRASMVNLPLTEPTQNQPPPHAAQAPQDPAQHSPTHGRDRNGSLDVSTSSAHTTASGLSGTAPQGGPLSSLHPELRSGISLSIAHAHKIYFSGPLARRLELEPSGKPPHRQEGWVEVWAQLGGTTMSVWEMKAIEEASKQGQEVPPSYINVTDAFIGVLGSIEIPATATQPASKRTNILTLNTAGSNLLLFSAPSGAALVSWAAALRLATWEKSRLEEIYTGHLLRMSLTMPNGDFKQPKTALTRGKLEGWVRIRLAGQVDWKRVYAVVSSAYDPLSSPNIPGAKPGGGVAVPASVFTPPRPPSPGATSNKQSNVLTKRRMSGIFRSSGSAHGHSPAAALGGPQPPPPSIAFHAAPPPARRARAPLLTLTHVSQAFALYPERPEMISKSNLFKLEALLGSEGQGIGQDRFAGKMAGREGWVIVQPEMGEGDGGAAGGAASTGKGSMVMEMLKWLVAIHDAFGLYGRPAGYTWDPREPTSMMFSYPVGPMRDHLFLDRELAEALDPNDDRTSSVRARLLDILLERMRGPPTGSLSSQGHGQEHDDEHERTSAESHHSSAASAGPQLPPLDFPTYEEEDEYGDEDGEQTPRRQRVRDEDEPREDGPPSAYNPSSAMRRTHSVLTRITEQSTVRGDSGDTERGLGGSGDTERQFEPERDGSLSRKSAFTERFSDDDGEMDEEETKTEKEGEGERESGSEPTIIAGASVMQSPEIVPEDRDRSDSPFGPAKAPAARAESPYAVQPGRAESPYGAQPARADSPFATPKAPAARAESPYGSQPVASTGSPLAAKKALPVPAARPESPYGVQKGPAVTATAAAARAESPYGVRKGPIAAARAESPYGVQAGGRAGSPYGVTKTETAPAARAESPYGPASGARSDSPYGHGAETPPLTVSDLRPGNAFRPPMGPSMDSAYDTAPLPPETTMGNGYTEPKDYGFPAMVESQKAPAYSPPRQADAPTPKSKPMPMPPPPAPPALPPPLPPPRAPPAVPSQSTARSPPPPNISSPPLGMGTLPFLGQLVNTPPVTLLAHAPAPAPAPSNERRMTPDSLPPIQTGGLARKALPPPPPALPEEPEYTDSPTTAGSALLPPAKTFNESGRPRPASQYSSTGDVSPSSEYADTDAGMSMPRRQQTPIAFDRLAGGGGGGAASLHPVHPYLGRKPSGAREMKRNSRADLPPLPSDSQTQLPFPTQQPKAQQNTMHSPDDDLGADALAALSYMEQQQSPRKTEPPRPPQQQQQQTSPPRADPAQFAHTLQPPDSPIRNEASVYPSSFTASKHAAERKAKLQAQQARREEAVSKPGRPSGARLAKGTWDRSSDEEEEEEEEDEEDEVSEEAQAPARGRKEVVRPPPRDASMPREIHAPQPVQVPPTRFEIEPASPPPRANLMPADAQGHSRFMARQGRASPGVALEGPARPPSQLAPDRYQSANHSRNSSEQYDDPARFRQTYQEDARPQSRSRERYPSQERPAQNRQSVWTAVLDRDETAPPVGPKVQPPNRNTFISIEPNETMTKAFTPHGLLQAGIQDKHDRSAKRQEEIARETGASLINVPSKPPPPQTGLLGAITAHERERNREGGMGATLTEREREKRLAEERQRRLDDYQRQQLDQHQQALAHGGQFDMYAQNQPFPGFNPMGGGMMHPMMTGMMSPNPMMGANPMMMGGGYGMNMNMNPMMYGGMMPYGGGWGGNITAQQQQLAAQAAMEAYQRTMMAYSQAGSMPQSPSASEAGDGSRTVPATSPGRVGAGSPPMMSPPAWGMGGMPMMGMMPGMMPGMMGMGMGGMGMGMGGMGMGQMGSMSGLAGMGSPNFNPQQPTGDLPAFNDMAARNRYSSFSGMSGASDDPRARGVSGESSPAARPSGANSPN